MDLSRYTHACSRGLLWGHVAEAAGLKDAGVKGCMLEAAELEVPCPE